MSIHGNAGHLFADCLDLALGRVSGVMATDHAVLWIMLVAFKQSEPAKLRVLKAAVQLALDIQKSREQDGHLGRGLN